MYVDHTPAEGHTSRTYAQHKLDIRGRQRAGGKDTKLGKKGREGGSDKGGGSINPNKILWKSLKELIKRKKIEELISTSMIKYFQILISR